MRRLALCVVLFTTACKDREPTDKDVAIAEARARQAEAEAEKARVEAHAPSNASTSAVRFGKSKVDVAALMTKELAYEAFGEWAQTHPNQQCPANLSELTQYLDHKDEVDPWGKPYEMRCGANLPAGLKGGMGIRSAGPDGRFDTNDDVRSWDGV